ncbi:hypothetical protein DSECCO2_392230 [anaerobic digester metagenome]
MESIITVPKKKIERFFKVYCKNIKTNENDSIFNIIGNTEPDLTKSLAFCLSYSQEFLEELLNKLKIKDVKDVVISAEQLSKKSEYRRDISLNINNINGSKELVIIEAKSPCKNGSITKDIEAQLSNYFNSHYYADIHENTKLTGVSLQKAHIYTKDIGKIRYISITWLDIISILKKIKDNIIIDNDNNSLLKAFYNHLIRASNLKTYEAEIFSPPCGNSYSRIEEHNIYCCPADRSLKECLYLMPRLPVNGKEDLIRNKYPDIKLTENKGKGIAMEMYQISDSFIVSTSHIELIENEDIKNKVKGWIQNSEKDEDLKVYILGKKLKFERPKFTKGQNNAYQGYYKLHEIWSDTIKGA